MPGDKSVSHRYVMLGAIARGVTTLTDLSPGADVASSIRCFQDLGVDIRLTSPNGARITGRGWNGLIQTKALLDAGNSGTTLRLAAGLVAGRPMTTSFIGDESLSRRPMNRVIAPLEAMGARITSTSGRAPITVHGGALTGIHWKPPIPSAQVKSALMLAALSARGETVIEEFLPTRDHSERAFPAFGLDVRVAADGVRVAGGQEASAPDGVLQVPGDPSSAAVWAASAAAITGSSIQVEGVLLNPRRLGFIEALRQMGADVETSVQAQQGGELVGTIRVKHGSHSHGRITGADVPDLIDELPVLAARAALGGSLEVTGAEELRVKESDRISALVTGLRALGVSADERPDGFVIDGSRQPRGGVANACGDHRLVMAFALVGLGAAATTTIEGADVVGVSYPGFARDLASLTA